MGSAHPPGKGPGMAGVANRRAERVVSAIRTRFPIKTRFMRFA